MRADATPVGIVVSGGSAGDHKGERHHPQRDDAQDYGGIETIRTRGTTSTIRVSGEGGNDEKALETQNGSRSSGRVPQEGGNAQEEESQRVG
jgi:hypothetical protein